MRMTSVSALSILLIATSCSHTPQTEHRSHALNTEAATVTLLQQDGTTAQYSVTWNPAPTTVDQLDVNTVNISKGGTYVLYNGDGTKKGATRTSDGTIDPTTTALDLPYERTSLNDDEKSWIKAGALTVVVSNPTTGQQAQLQSVTCYP